MPGETQIRSSRLISLLCTVSAIWLILFPPAALVPGEAKAAALVIMAIGLWATAVIPEFLTALFFFLFAMLFSVSTPGVIFSGFESTAFWLVFGGLVIGVAINNTGIGTRLAMMIAQHLHRSYSLLITGIVIIGILFAFLMPSALGRVVLLTPIAMAITEHFGFEKGSNGRIGIILATVLGSFMPAFAVLPANVSNMVLAGLSENLFSITPLYGDYLLLHFPVLGLLKSMLLILLIVWLYPDHVPKADPQKPKTTIPLSRNEARLSVILITLLLLWMSDALHHISPAWIALGGALILLLPGVGLVSKQDFSEKINFASLFFVGGVLGLGALVHHSGLGDRLAQGIIYALPLSRGETFINYMSLATTATLTGVFTTLPGVPAVLTPLAGELAQATDLPLKSVLMSQVLGFSITLFPYQAPPIVIGMQLSGEKITHAIRLCLFLALISVIFLLPINYFWWRLLGWL